MLDGKVETYKIVTSSMFGIITNIIHGTNRYLIALIILMAIDTIFGWAKGFKKNNWNSRKARWGIYGKIFELMLIVTLYVLGIVFNFHKLFNMGVWYFILIEFASIIENYAIINGNIPTGIVELLKKLKFNINTILVNKLKKFIDTALGDVDDENK